MKEKNNKKVIAIVVTYNRKELLKECIEALLNQDYDNCDIFIVDNASTDGTENYIKQYVDGKKIFYKNTEENLGGAGGFNFGIKEVIKLGYEYIWIMDDDTIVNEGSLKELMNAADILNDNYGFLSSIAVWKDGSICKMNKQKISSNWYEKAKYLKYSLLKTYYATFVSLLIKAEVVKKEGLPIKDFFIWGDDIEYTDRISSKYPCYIVGKSVVMHKTNNNEGSNIAKDAVERMNRYRFAYRNEIYIAKKKGIKGLARQFAKIILHIARVIVESPKNKMKKIWIIVSSSVKGVFFNPKIEYVNKS